MYCNICKIEFEPWADRWSLLEFKRCKICVGKGYIQGFSLVGKDTYCIECGAVLEKYKRKTRSGNYISTSAGKLYCDNCKPQKSSKRYCVVCNVLILDKAHKYCPDHKPPYKINPVINRRTSIAWAKNNPKKATASRLARYHSYKVAVIYECPCDSKNKQNHHFDYDRPYEVIRLCPKCHSLENIRLKKVAN